MAQNEEQLIVFKENWKHIRHKEIERMLFMFVFVILFIFFDKQIEAKLYLLVLNAIFFLISIKTEIVISDYVSKNNFIAKNLKLEESMGGRVTKGLWKYIRLKYLVPTIYVIFFLVILMYTNGSLLYNNLN